DRAPRLCQRPTKVRLREVLEPDACAAPAPPPFEPRLARAGDREVAQLRAPWRDAEGGEGGGRAELQLVEADRREQVGPAPHRAVSRRTDGIVRADDAEPERPLFAEQPGLTTHFPPARTDDALQLPRRASDVANPRAQR